MTDGFEDRFGSASSSQVPTEGRDEARVLNPEVGGPVGEGGAEGGDSLEGDPLKGEPMRPSRPGRPFRAWGAAHEDAPSLWSRLAAWIGGLFSRNKPESRPPLTRDAYGSASAPDGALAAESSPGPASAPTPTRTSFDDLDAPWNDDPFPVEERRSSRPSAERPSIEDFATNWDGTYGRELETSGEMAVPASSQPDPVWDLPAVNDTPASPPPAIGAADFADVWDRHQSADDVASDTGVTSTADGARASEATLQAGAASRAEASPKRGFFARLFGRASELPPADADFAEDAAASTTPSDEDFAETATVGAPDAGLAMFDDDIAGSTTPGDDDFAETAAMTSAGDDDFAREMESLGAEVVEASFAMDRDTGVIEEEVIVEQVSVEMESVEMEAVDDEVEMAAGAIDRFDPTSSSYAEPGIELPIEAAATPLPEVDLSKKPGFFSSLLKRVSRSMFIPKAAAEAEPEPALTLESTAPAAAEPFVAAEPEATVPPAPEPVVAAEPAAIVPPAPEPVFPSATVDDDIDLSSTQPFPPFRDARDDFADEPRAEAVDSSRPTEEVVIPPVDDDKTGEFEVVPGVPEGLDGKTAETLPAGFWGRLFARGAEVAETSGEVPAAPVEDKMPFVLAKFRTFYNEVIRDKHQKSDVISGFATAVLSAPASDMADPEFAAALLSKRLSEMLELQAAESNWTGGDAARYYPEAQYAMVALADETFATIEWPGRSAWHKHMLEPRLYGTRGADVEFFKRIDRLLKDPAPEKGARDLARLYLMVIASGFRGKFRVPNVKRPLAEYRRRLYEFSHQADALELYARERRIFPDAIEHTLASRAVGRFTPAQKWVATVLVLTALYLGVSHYAWVRLSADLRDVMSRIQSSISQPAPR